MKKIVAGGYPMKLLLLTFWDIHFVRVHQEISRLVRYSPISRLQLVGSPETIFMIPFVAGDLIAERE